jgi:hypothetical protein
MNVDLQTFIGAAARDPDLLAQLRRDPDKLSARLGLALDERQAIRSADLLMELDRDPIGQAALTLTGGVTKTQRHTKPTKPMSLAALERLPRRDLMRLLTLSLQNEDFAAKMRSDLGL